MHQAVWYKNRLPNDWLITVSENGWTNNEISFKWLVNVFNHYTKDCTIGQYQLLILDGYSSHITSQFDQYCINNLIIVLCMPLYSSHLLQPFNVACFLVLLIIMGRT